MAESFTIEERQLAGELALAMGIASRPHSLPLPYLREAHWLLSPQGADAVARARRLHE